tara:strand:+ start:1381 stop:1590 length:210 start_codon:yes stop_codon:yes gene_type:complete
MEKIYRVTVSKIVEYAIEVEAETPQEAMELIDEEIQQNDGIYNYEIEAGCHEWNVTHAELHEGYYVTAS